MHPGPVRPLAIFLLVLCGLTAAAAAQWLKHPTAGIPRTADGTPDLSAPAPRTADGTPDLSGMWITGNPAPCGGPFLECGIELPFSREIFSFGVSLPGGLPYQPWAAALVKARVANESRDDPHVRCLPDTFLRSYGLPHISKFVQTPALLVVLNEVNASYRQIFTDGRPLPDDPTPAWNGYSSGRWDGDTLVVESIGFRDDLWLDMSGSPLTEEAKVRERIRRPTFGYLEVEVTVDDPKAYTKAWTVQLKQQFIADTEMIDEICLENEKSAARLAGPQ